MAHIPTREELAQEARDKAAAAAAANVPNEVRTYTDQIVAAMRKGDNYVSVSPSFPSAAAQAQLSKDFAASGYTLTFRQARTGGSISW